MIPDLSITASSALLDPNTNVFTYDGFNGRLDGNAFWNPTDNEDSWVQVDFGYPIVKVMNGIVTQGSSWWFNWVETLKVQYRNNTGSLTTILDGGRPKV